MNVIRDSKMIKLKKEWRDRERIGLCPICGKHRKHFETHRKIYCSEKCLNEAEKNIISYSKFRNDFLEKHGRYCDKCGFRGEQKEEKPNWREELFSKLLEDHKDEIYSEKQRRRHDAEKYFINALKDIEDLNYSNYTWRKFFICLLGDSSLFTSKYVNLEVDHKQAIMNSGDQWDENNLQVLCSKCHKEKTIEDIRINKNK